LNNNDNNKNSILIYDIETYTPLGYPDSSKDRLKLFGCYSFKTNKYYILTNKQDIQKIINAHKFLIGFNVEGYKGEKGYDNPILKREGINLQYKIIIDLIAIFKERAGGMKIKKGMLQDLLMKYSLDYITRTLDLVNDESAKMKMDYNLFKKEIWTKEETEYISEYLKRDVEVTKKLYEWCEEYFSVLKDFVGENDIEKKKYLTDSIAKFVYKAICRSLNWVEIYGTNTDIELLENEEAISGGYVSFPSSEEYHNDIYALDFTSLYPHIMIQCNLFSRKKDILKDDNRPVWRGNSVWKVDGIYYSDILGDVAKLQRKLFFLRLYYKRKFVLVDTQKVVKMKDALKYINEKIFIIDSENMQNLEFKEIILTEQLANDYKQLADKGDDKREYSVKIILNTSYGLLDNPYYALVYDRIAAQDCTNLGKQFIKYARKIFRNNGYIICYSDTDSIYLQDPYKNKEKLLDIKKQIIEYIKSTLPFPQLTFDMEDEADIDHIFFFKGKIKDIKDENELEPEEVIGRMKSLLKKNYIYVKKKAYNDMPWKDRLVIKNLGIRKKSISPLTRKIFWDYLAPQIVENGVVKFSKTYIKNLMIELLEKDIELACLRKDVRNLDYYQKSQSGIQAQISLKYGPGIHFLIPNVRNIGVGKGVSLCTLEEFQDNKLSIGDIDMSNFWNELDYFIKPTIMKDIFSFT
jgi:DNA polymerase elongation subunit (family B)